MSAMEKVRKARAGLILDHCFFGSLALRQELKQDDTCKTMYTDGKTIGFNSQFVESLTLGQLKGVLAHEVLHVGNLHHTRRNNRDFETWNDACDYAINDILLQSGFELPNGGLSGMGTDKTAETIYNTLSKKKQSNQSNSQGNKNGNGQGNKSSNFGEIRDAKNKQGQKPTQAEIAEIESQARVNITQAMNQAKARGKLPAGLDRYIKEILKPVLPWKEILNRFLQEKTKNDYTWIKPNRRYMSSGYYLPSLYSEELKEIAIAIDTSGSLNEKQLSEFINEIKDIVTKTKVTIIYCDSKVQAVEVFEKAEQIKTNPRGGGGTDFRPPFYEIENMQESPVCLIYFTDGYCDLFPEEPEYPVLWIVTENRYFTPPFGEVTLLQ